MDITWKVSGGWQYDFLQPPRVLLAYDNPFCETSLWRFLDFLWITQVKHFSVNILTLVRSSVTSKFCLQTSWFATYLAGWTSWSFRKILETRMLSSRMHTDRSLTVYYRSLLPGRGGVSAVGGCRLLGGVCSGGVCLLGGGCLLQGCLLWGCLLQGVSAPGGCLLLGGGGGCLLGGCLLWGCLLWGVSAQGSVCSGGCLLWGGVCSRGCLLGGVCSWGGCLLQGGVCSQGGTCCQGGVCSRGVYPRMYWGRHPPVNRITDTCKNITLAQFCCGR